MLFRSLVRCVEEQRIVTIAAEKRVGSGSATQVIGPAVSGEDIIPSRAQELIVIGAASEDIGARTTGLGKTSDGSWTSKPHQLKHVRCVRIIQIIDSRCHVVPTVYSKACSRMVGRTVRRGLMFETTGVGLKMGLRQPSIFLKKPVNCREPNDRRGIGPAQNRQRPENKGLSGGRDRDRTCDPFHVKEVLFR